MKANHLSKTSSHRAYTSFSVEFCHDSLLVLTRVPGTGVCGFLLFGLCLLDVSLFFPGFQRLGFPLRARFSASDLPPLGAAGFLFFFLLLRAFLTIGTFTHTVRLIMVPPFFLFCAVRVGLLIHVFELRPLPTPSHRCPCRALRRFRLPLVTMATCFLAPCCASFTVIFFFSLFFWCLAQLSLFVHRDGDMYPPFNISSHWTCSPIFPECDCCRGTLRSYSFVYCHGHRRPWVFVSVHAGPFFWV